MISNYNDFNQKIKGGVDMNQTEQTNQQTTKTAYFRFTQSPCPSQTNKIIIIIV